MKRNLFIPSLLVIMFVGPMIAATITYIYRDNFKFSAKSYGTLVQPTKISFKKLYNTAFKPIKLEKQKWHMVYVAPTACDNSCKQEITWLHNGHLALHKYSKKIIAAVVYANDINLKIAPRQIIIVDPNNDYILKYDVEITPANVKKITNDLKKLLRH